MLILFHFFVNLIQLPDLNGSLVKGQDYSDLKLVTGFAKAVLMACVLTEITAIIKANAAAPINIQIFKDVR